MYKTLATFHNLFLEISVIHMFSMVNNFKHYCHGRYLTKTRYSAPDPKGEPCFDLTVGSCSTGSKAGTRWQRGVAHHKVCSAPQPRKGEKEGHALTACTSWGPMRLQKSFVDQSPDEHRTAVTQSPSKHRRVWGNILGPNHSTYNTKIMTIM